MAEGRQREAWDHTSHLLAMLFNANRDPKKTSPAGAANFHPLVKREKPARPEKKAKIGILKSVFVRDEGRAP